MHSYQTVHCFASICIPPPPCMCYCFSFFHQSLNLIGFQSPLYALDKKFVMVKSNDTKAKFCWAFFPYTNPWVPDPLPLIH